MKNNLYGFTDAAGSFKSGLAHKIKTLYLPLGNEVLMSSITADLHGDIKSGQHSFLLEPASRSSLYFSRASRNFWVYIDKDRVWSAAGVSKELRQISRDEFKLEAGQLWQRVSRKNKKIGLESQILSFIPSGPDALEVMQVKLTNISKARVKFVPYAAIPLYARSADNLRDHRQVTSLLTRIKLDKYGLKVKPTLVFDESGHRKNNLVYYAAACDSRGAAPRYIYPTQEIFCGDSGDFEAPEAVLENKLPPEEFLQGREPMAAMRFAEISLAPGASAVYTVLLGIAPGDCDLKSLIKKYGRPEKVSRALERTRRFWEEQAQRIQTDSGNKHFDNWLRWVSIQPQLRKIFGCSFLPDFDYGKGGRGWRDLWQDCLGLILNEPEKVRNLLINNFCGVKIDGSNATIIGKQPGEFIADRNNISRVWMDHGVWPLITLDLYLQETADLAILSAPATYFRNHQLDRARGLDRGWTPAYGNRLKTKSGRIYSGTVLEHLLVQNLVQFYNVGAHNHVLLEGADWNDGLDMAKENGESVAFSAMYARNLLTLAQILLQAGIKEVQVAEELKILLADFDYSDIAQKRRILEKYFSKTREHLSGRKIRLDAAKLSAALKAKSRWMKEHIRRSEWLKEGFFNGYYDNRKKRVDGSRGGAVRMTLASQVFPIMSQVAADEQVKKILANIDRYLSDKTTGGIHLNTDFNKEQHDLGRAFSFSYGDKENGAVFSHMVVMLAYALYQQGFCAAGWKALSSLYKLAANTDKSKVYPCLPEYFDLEGRGMYPYLTGSASWFMLTLLTQAFGVRGLNGDLLLEPKFCAQQFTAAGKIAISRTFAGRRLKIIYAHSGRPQKGPNRIRGIRLNRASLVFADGCRAVIPRKTIIGLPKGKLNLLEIDLG